MNNGENMYSQNLQQPTQQVMSVNWLFDIDNVHDSKQFTKNLLEYASYVSNKYNSGVSIDEISNNFDIYIKEFLNTFNFTFNLIKEGVKSKKITQEEFDEYKKDVQQKCQTLIETQNAKHGNSNTIGLQDKISEKIDKTNHQEAIKQLKQELNNLKLIAEHTVASIYSCCANGTNILLLHDCQLTFTPNEVPVPEELVEENRSLDAIFQIISAFAKDFDEEIKKLSSGKGKGAKFIKGIGLSGTGCVVQ